MTEWNLYQMATSYLIEMFDFKLLLGKELGKDALRVLREFLKRSSRNLNDVAVEICDVRATAKWVTLQVKHFAKS